MRSIPTLANYDYVIDWVFTESGELRVDLGATGIDAVKGVATRSADDPTAADETRSGMLVAPGLVAVHHDHFFSVRLDFDVDGPRNRFVREKLVVDAPAEASPRRSLWRLGPAPQDERPRAARFSCTQSFVEAFETQAAPRVIRVITTQQIKSLF